MRKIEKIVVHCSANKEDSGTTAADIARWHVQGLGWKEIGYHYVVEEDGRIVKGRDESIAGAHAAGHNRRSIGVCYTGGLDRTGNPKDTRTPAQKVALVRLLRELRSRYPEAVIVGHNALNRLKECPCFDAAKEYERL